jgi:hypothetical protein
MPNWCNNNLEVSGTKEYLDVLEKAANESNLLETIKPIGEWKYDTAVSEWGTKWDIADASVDRVSDNDLVMYFDTAWAPPVTAYETLLEKDEIESVVATYFEPGMGFTGVWDNSDDIFYDDLGSLVKSGAIEADPLLEQLNEEYGFDGWFEEEPDELVEWIEDGVKAKTVSHDV